MPSSRFFQENGQFPSTFFFTSRLGAHDVNPLAWDLFNCLYSIYYSDFRTNRIAGGKVVVDVDVTSKSEMEKVAGKLLNLVRFMTGNEEQWEINFHQLPDNIDIIDTTNEQGLLPVISSPQNIALVSGGLDSFAGISLDLQSGKQIQYVTLWTNDTEWGRVKNNFDGRIPPLALTAHPKTNHRKEHLMQRSRSLAFFGVGVIECLLLGARELVLTENGIMSLNPGMDTRLPTKTTHPRVIFEFNSLLCELGIDVVLKHRGKLQTKAELIREISPDHRDCIRFTRTCGRNRQDPRYNEKGHCGACSPCVLRRISIVGAELEEYDDEYCPAHQPTHGLHADFRQSVGYFVGLRNSIREGKIASELRLQEKWLSPSGFEDVRRMLDTFAGEVDTFLERLQTGI